MPTVLVDAGLLMTAAAVRVTALIVGPGKDRQIVRLRDPPVGRHSTLRVVRTHPALRPLEALVVQPAAVAVPLKRRLGAPR